LLNPGPIVREKSEREFLVDVFGDDLGSSAGLKDDSFAILQYWDLVVTLARELPNERAIAIGNVDDFELNASEFENAPLHNAEWAPRELNQLDHAFSRAIENWKRAAVKTNSGKVFVTDVRRARALAEMRRIV
jgi:predicted GNAT superfamily acetyltransferase